MTDDGMHLEPAWKALPTLEQRLTKAGYHESDMEELLERSIDYSTPVPHTMVYGKSIIGYRRREAHWA